MAELGIDLEAVVREVLRELGVTRAAGEAALPAAPAAPAAPAPAVPPPAPAPAPALPPTELALNDRVVTLGSLAGRLEGIRKVTVLSAAVVTPAVRDELYRRNIALAVAADGAPRVRPGSLRLVLVTAGGRVKAEPLAKTLEGEGILVVPHDLDCLLAAVDLLAHQVNQGKTLGLLLTRHAAAALCLANRQSKVRAVPAGDPRATSAAVASVGANLLVADPQAVGLHQLKRLAIDFCRDGVQACPAVFAERLG